MMKIAIKSTQNPTILKFEFPDFITQNESFEFKNIDEANASPLAQQLFYLPFVKTVYISGNFIAIEKYSIVEWEDVQEAVAEQIEEFVNNGGVIIKVDENKLKKQPITVYGETTPNPATLKFVVSRMLTKNGVEFKNIDETKASPLAKDLFSFPFVKEVFIDDYKFNLYKTIPLNPVDMYNFLIKYLPITNQTKNSNDNNTDKENIIYKRNHPDFKHIFDYLESIKQYNDNYAATVIQYN